MTNPWPVYGVFRLPIGYLPRTCSNFAIKEDQGTFKLTESRISLREYRIRSIRKALGDHSFPLFNVISFTTRRGSKCPSGNDCDLARCLASIRSRNLKGKEAGVVPSHPKLLNITSPQRTQRVEFLSFTEGRDSAEGAYRWVPCWKDANPTSVLNPGSRYG